MNGGFWICTTMPRTKVSLTSSVKEICSSTVLVVEENNDAPDPLQYLDQVCVVDSFLLASHLFFLNCRLRMR